MSDLAAFAIGVAIGLLITFGVLWRRRGEVAKAWQRRGANAGSRDASPKMPAHTRLTIAIHALAAVASACLAIVASDSAVRAVSLLVCVVAVTSICALLWQSRRSRSST